MFEIFQSEKTGKFHFRLKAKNGQIILSSQAYANLAGTKKGVESVKTNAALDERFERKEAANGKHFFNLLAANKQIIGSSQFYASKEGLEKGVASVKNNAPNAEVKDLTAA